MATTSSWIKRKRGENTSAVDNYLCSFHIFVCRPFGVFAPIFRVACRIWRNILCVKNSFFWGGGGGWVGGYNNFLLLGSGSLLLSCSFPSPSCLTLSPHFPPSIPPYFFPSRTVRVSLYECCRVSLKSTDMGAVGLGRGAAATPLPHPEQLLILRNRIISAKVAALFRSQEHGKQTKRTSCAETEMQRGGRTCNRKLYISLILTSLTAQMDLETNSDASVLIWDWPRLNPTSFLFKACSEGFNCIGLL